MITELFVELNIESMSRDNLARLGPCGYENLELSNLEAEKLNKVIQVLDHPELKRMALNDEITFAMIKPGANDSNHNLDDVEAADTIENEIKTPLSPVFNISIIFSGEDFESFYAGQKKTLSQLPPLRYLRHKNRWEEFKEYMTSGPTTVLLLYSPNCNAVEEWRDQIGPWDVEHERDTKTLRGKYALDNYTSIVHGSDSPESVVREIKIIRNHLNDLL